MITEITKDGQRVIIWLLTSILEDLDQEYDIYLADTMTCKLIWRQLQTHHVNRDYSQANDIFSIRETM